LGARYGPRIRSAFVRIVLSSPDVEYRSFGRLRLSELATTHSVRVEQAGGPTAPPIVNDDEPSPRRDSFFRQPERELTHGRRCQAIITLCKSRLQQIT
jgi:hypothetical protein